MRLALAIASLLLAACGGRFPRPPYSPQPTSALVVLSAPPPPARVENVPPRPDVSGVVWIDGEWTFRRGRWSWSPGHWVVPPPDQTFSPWVVVRGVDGQLWQAPGTWRDAKGNAVEAPTPIVVAVVDSGQVVNASGVTEVTGRTLKAARKAGAEKPAP